WLCAFEEHVFENVRQPGTEMFVLVDAARGAPRLHTCHRSAVIFLHDDRESIWQKPFLCGARWKGDPRRIVGRCCFQIGRTKHTRNDQRQTRRKSDHTDLGTGNSSRGSDAVGLAGANGFTKASLKSYTFLKSSSESSSVFPKIPASKIGRASCRERQESSEL